LTAELISAQELHDAKVKREVLVRWRDALNKDIVDLDSVLSQPKESTSSLQALAESLSWTAFKKGGGEWAYMAERDGTPIQRVKSLLEAIRSSTAEKLVLGKFEYSISGGKFLNRRRAE
jgi:hypothetical protein